MKVERTVGTVKIRLSRKVRLAARNADLRKQVEALLEERRQTQDDVIPKLRARIAEYASGTVKGPNISRAQLLRVFATGQTAFDRARNLSLSDPASYFALQSALLEAQKELYALAEAINVTIGQEVLAIRE